MENNTNQPVCPVCNNSKDAVKIGQHPDMALIAAKGDIFFCNNCLHGFTFPLPTVAQLEKYYLEQYRKDRKETIADHYKLGCVKRSGSHVSLLEKFLPSFKNRNVLEIGSGIGTTLELLSQKGARITGYEADAIFAAYTKKNLPGASIYNQYFVPGATDEKYDVIIMSHVLEHISDPHAFINDLKKNLTDTGIIFIEVPNESKATITSLVEKKIIGNMHLSYFSKNSLSGMYKNDFKIAFNSTAGLKHIFNPKTLNRFVRKALFFMDFDMFNYVNKYSGDGRIWSRIILKTNTSD